MADIIAIALLESKAVVHRVADLLRYQHDLQLTGTAPTENALRAQVARWRPAVVVVHNLTLIRNIAVFCGAITQAHAEAKFLLAREHEDAATVAACLKKGFIAYSLAAECADIADVIRYARYRYVWLDAAVAQIISDAFQQAARKRRLPRILNPSAQGILDGIIAGATCQMIAQSNTQWTEQVVRAQVYNIIRHYQQL